MFNYKGVVIWYNELQHVWMLQKGYEIIGKAATLSAAKCKATWCNKQMNEV